MRGTSACLQTYSSKPDFRADWQRYESFRKFVFILLQDGPMLTSKEIFWKAFLPSALQVSACRSTFKHLAQTFKTKTVLHNQEPGHPISKQNSHSAGKGGEVYLSQDKQQENKTLVPLNLPIPLRVTNSYP